MNIEDQDILGGFNFDDKAKKFPAGSVWENEGKRLYRLVREHRPAVILEVGTNYGCSTSHLALACKHNDFGKVYSVDNRQQLGDETGSYIPADLRTWVELIQADALKSLPKAVFDRKIDMLFEDGQHTTGFTQTVLELYRHVPLIAVHDFCHRTAGVTVAPEARRILGEPTEIFFQPPADCGLGIWIK
jgi:predicted O-methyltransferase YrrM